MEVKLVKTLLLSIVAVLQKISGEHDGRGASFLLSLDGHSKQAGDIHYLPYDFSFSHATYWPSVT